MRSVTEYLWFQTKQRRELVNLTDRDVQTFHAELDGQRKKRLVVKAMGE